MSESGGMSVNCLTAGGQNVATDVKGNITTLPVNLRPAGSTTAMNLTWDSDNKLRSADIDANGTADVNFQYDALGRRVARSGTGGSEVYVQMDQQTIADYPVGGAATTPTFRYVYASYIDEPVVRKGPTSTSTVNFYHRNQQFSITSITTSTGAISERYAYTAYGQPTILDASASVLSSSAINNRYTYTGREWDATLGLHHFRARWMSPSAGRFLTRDPIGFKGSRWNLYRNDFELDDMDPSGLRKVCCEFRLGWTISDFITKELECDSGKSAGQCCKDYGSTWHRLWAVEGASDGPCKQSPEKCQLALVPIETTVLTTTTVATNCGKVLRIHPVVQIAYVTLCVNKYYVGNDDGDLPDEDDPEPKNNREVCKKCICVTIHQNGQKSYHTESAKTVAECVARAFRNPILYNGGCFCGS
jgi:RHS repeat-associated protein